MRERNGEGGREGDGELETETWRAGLERGRKEREERVSGLLWFLVKLLSVIICSSEY